MNTRWLLQSFDDCPEILRSDAIPAWLGPAEQRRLAGFKVEKRRRDWLLGRWTAKKLVQRYLEETRGERSALAELYIGTDPDGAPYAARCEGEGGWGDLFERLPVSLSISHSHGVAFCGLIERAGLGMHFPAARSPSLGCDIELVEPREMCFVKSFFTEKEIAMLYAAIERTDLFATAIWSGKEAVLKALRRGLRLDVRCIACLLEAAPTLPTQEWRPFQIDLDEQLSAQFPGAWSGWWRLHGQHVLTMAVFA